jgi:hypothetical protein
VKSAYNFFVAEYSKTLTDVEAKERLGECSKKWGEMKDKEK